MKEQLQKQLIVSLLIISCLIVGYLLFTVPGETTKHIESFAQVDSLIKKELYTFNINNHQIRTSSTGNDTTFSRKIYHVEVPYFFSKTQFHAELNQTFYDYSIGTPARVFFPEKDMDIHLLYQGTIIRTISLETNTDLLSVSNTLNEAILTETVLVHGGRNIVSISTNKQQDLT